jgi:queuine tRNA-ribosyltransferase
MRLLEILRSDGKARVGRLTTPHGSVDTPAFLPVGTAASVKGVTPDQLRAAGVQMVLANTYHLMLRPGPQTVRALGGVHGMMAWDAPVLTDSGGYQVFSLAHLRRIDENGVTFRSHIDGQEVCLTAEGAVETQRELAADVIMQLDECPSSRAGRNEVAKAVGRSAAWAARASRTWEAHDRRSAFGRPQALFGIQQGGVHADLRAESAAALVALDLPGYAIGGLSVGEPREAMCDVLDAVDDQLPHDRPRYLMGVGEPRDVLAAVQRGVDLFDCVLPTRNGRNAQAFTWNGRVRLRNSRWAACDEPLDPRCDCYACRRFSRGTLRHLFLAGEMLAATLVSIHNLRFFTSLMSAIRAAIASGDLAARQRQWLAAMQVETQ